MGCYTRWADYEVMLTQVKHRKRDHQCSSAQVQSPTRTSEQQLTVIFATCSSAYLDGRDFVGVNRHGCEYLINVISYSFRCGRLSRCYSRSCSIGITITMFKPRVST